MWGIAWYPLRLLEAQGLAGLWSTLISFGAVSLCALVWLRGQLRACSQAPLGLLLMALAAGWCNVAFILAVLEGPVVRILLLFYLAPVWTAILGVLVLGETPSRRSLIVLLTSLSGAGIMLWDPGQALPWPRSQADWLALSAGLAFAISNIMVRKIQSVTIPVKSAVSLSGVVVVALLGIALTSSPVPEVTHAVLLWGVSLGVFGFGLMTVLVQYGVTHMPVYRSSVILLFEIVAGAASSYWLSDERLLTQEWIGGSIIVLAAWLAARASLTQNS